MTTLNPSPTSLPTKSETAAERLARFSTWPSDGSLPPGYTHSPISTEDVEFYREQGFLVVLDALSQADLKEMNDEAVAICRGKRGELKSGKEIDYSQFEGMSDDEVISYFLCIHHVHKFSDTMKHHLADDAMVDVLTKVIGPNVKCMQSMLFVKSAGKPGQAWHQDEDYIPTRDRSLTGGWIALDDATIENGCLWIIPGSHRRGILWPQYPHVSKDYDCALMSYDFPYEEERDAVPVEVPAGAIVFFNGYLLHKSLPNRAKGGFRRVLVNHYMSAESFLPWGKPADTHFAKHDYRDIIMIAGEDPYSWKGTEDLAKPSVRADGNGGCGDGRMELEEWRETADVQKRARV